MKSICDFEDYQNQTGLTYSDISTIKNICFKNKNVKKIILFGSRAKKTWKKESDIDLCLYGNELNQNDITQISYKLNEETLMPYKFDILLWNEIINSEISKHIERCGIIL